MIAVNVGIFHVPQFILFLGVGKSCLLLRFCEDFFTPSFITTIGIDFRIRLVDMEAKRIKIQIWDTAGQERFRTITTAYYRGAMGIMLVYDVTDERSFNNIRNWIRNIDQYASEGVNKILIGNKCDDVERRVVERERGAELAREYGLKFMETSAKNNVNVDEGFLSLAKDIKKRLIDTGKLINEQQINAKEPVYNHNSASKSVSISKREKERGERERERERDHNSFTSSFKNCC